MTRSLIQRRIAWTVTARLVLHENLGDLRMPDRLAGIVGQKVLLGNVGELLYAVEILAFYSNV
jgi:hypothetical protein